MKTQIPRMMLFWSLLTVALMSGLAAWVWVKLPANATIPVHWNWRGEIDRYGGKWEGLALLPLITLGLALLLYVLPYLDPRGDNVLRSAQAYRAIWVILLLFFLGFHTVLMLNLLGYGISINGVLLPGLGLLFMALGNIMGKLRRNYFMGIRTPWTLDNDLVWNRTHRLGGKLMFVAGALTLLAALFLPHYLATIVLLVTLLGAVLWSVAYSYWVWRSEVRTRQAT